MENIIPVICVNLLTFWLFYFNVPYSTGNELQEVSRNGVYRVIFCACSAVGFWLYKGIERLNNFIVFKLHLREAGSLHVLINVILYTVALGALTIGYDEVVSTAVGDIEGAELQLDLGDSYSKFSNLILWWAIINNFEEVTSVGTFFTALKSSLLGILGFVLFTLVFFSFIYGLLHQKVKQLNIVSRFFSNTAVSRLIGTDQTPERICEIPKAALASFVDFVEDWGTLRNFKNLGALFGFCALIVAYSVVRAVGGETADFKGLLVDLLDESGIITVVGSFVISFVCAKLVTLVGRFASKVLPTPIREKLSALSRRGNQVVETVRDKRDAWSAKFDRLFTMTGGPNRRRHSVGIPELHFE